jgi:putative Holliday junction resolvase
MLSEGYGDALGIMRTLALDYGAARTGVAVSDATGTIARPLTVVSDVDSEAGLASVATLVAEQGAERVVVGVPVSLDAREHVQARRARAFVRRLSERLTVPVTTYDERFTTKVARERGGAGPVDARAAAVILEDYLRAGSG